MNFFKNNILYIAAVLLAVGVLVYISMVALPKDTSTRVEPIVGNYAVSNEEVNLLFKYPASVTGLALIEPPVEPGGMLKDAYVLMQTAEYISFQSSTTESGTPPPPSISLFVFDLPPNVGEEDLSRDERLVRWATQNQSLTMYTASPDMVTTNIDGLDMYTYSVEGLYKRDVYLGAYRGNIYMFVGQYTDETDPIREQFQALLKTIEFQ